MRQRGSSPIRSLTAHLSRQQKKSMCPTSSAGQKQLFEVTNLNSGQGFDLGDNDCVIRLYEMIDCDEGGFKDTAGWRFR
jgi:hypothetical protein